ncbi:HAD family hydrolase [Microbacterium sp. M1A1_1b]
MTIRGIVFFDIDGTLVTSMSSSSFLARRFDHERDLDDAEAAYASGELSNQQVSAIDARGWSGHRVSEVEGWLAELPVIEGTDTVVSWCRENAIEPVLASLAWQPVSESIAGRFGFTPNGGPRVHVRSGTYDGTVAEHFDEDDKRDRSLALAAARGLTAASCCAIGDRSGGPSSSVTLRSPR